jgi:DNA-binding MarR family transcriptional regulator
MTTSADPEQIAAQMGALNAELVGQSMGAVLHILQAANLSMPRLVALMFLRRRGCATISELSAEINLALGTTSQAINQLVHSGLVERREDPADRRHKLITLTPQGAAIAAQVYQIRLDETARRLSALPPDLRARLGAALADALDALQLEQPSLNP